MTSSELAVRFPGYHLPSNILAVLQPDGGFLCAERSISSLVSLAKVHGADIHQHEQVISWMPSGDGVKVVTNHATYFAERLVITAGSWFSKLVPEFSQVVTPERQVVAWFEPYQPQLFSPNRFPVFNLILDEGHYYGFPIFEEGGFKFGRSHHLREKIDPDTMERECSPKDEQVIRKYAERFFPEGSGKTISLSTCIYTNTTDENFIIDTCPDFPQVFFAAGFSGHGFKFCTVIGEIMADLVESGRTAPELEMFSIGRFVTSC